MAGAHRWVVRCGYLSRSNPHAQFFKSEACRNELERFLDREKQLRRYDLILPVYYVNCAMLNEAVKWDDDPLAKPLQLASTPIGGSCAVS